MKKMMKMKTLTKIIMVLTILKKKMMMKKPKRSREDASHEESREARGVSSNLIDMMIHINMIGIRIINMISIVILIDMMIHIYICIILGGSALSY